MIAPMYKYAFLVHHDDYRAFLQSLREVGVAHIIETRREWTDETKALQEKYLRYKQYHQMLSQREVEAVPKETCPLAAELSRSLEDCMEVSYSLEQALQNARSTEIEMRDWKEVPITSIRGLEEHRVYFHFFRCETADWDPAWEREHHLEVYLRQGDELHFVIITRQSKAPNIGLEPVAMPMQTYQEVVARREQLEAQIADNEVKLDHLASCRYGLEQAMDAIADSIDWHQAIHQAQADQSGRLITLQVWVPGDSREALERFAAQLDVVTLDLRPSTEEDIPVKLKNNRFAKLFHPIGELFALPHHTELDLTAFFAPFYAIFFGLCLGDLGYGALLFAAGTIAKMMPVGRKNRDVFTLLQWLSFATMVAGVITGTFFGAEMKNMAWFSGMSDYFLGPNQLFQVAIWIGLFQIATGMVLKAFGRSRQFGFVYGLSSIGWLLGLGGSVMWWMDVWPPVHQWITFGGVGLVLFFSEPKGNIFKRVGLGLWELYGASGLVGDMLSYIRLFALGLSSAILGLVVNDIALSVAAGGSFFGWLFCLIILLIGHGMNFFLATLSAFVHPMRLTFVEFYKNAGFSGGGKPYKPFEKRLKTEV
jgi:V/A-type H+-transporting ATPase subunit I